MTAFIGKGRFLGYKRPYSKRNMKYRERLTWAGLHHIKDGFKAKDLAILINTNQKENIDTWTVAYALRKFKTMGYVKIMNTHNDAYVYQTTQLFKQLRSDE